MYVSSVFDKCTYGPCDLLDWRNFNRAQGVELSMGSLNVVLDEPVYEGFGVDSYITFQLFSLSPSNRRKGLHSLRFKGPV